ncbi:MAG: hypothetical protein FWH04_03750 [Oscillospiraceae bacterium]|nr:hypothetical protein [Oscillospiraceae bacterium]
MRNQGVWIMGVTTVLISLFVVLYMGNHILSLFSQPIQTVTAVLKDAQITCSVSGTVVRDEDVLPLPEGLIRFSVREGERVSVGQALAEAYRNSDELQRSREMRTLEEHRDLLGYVAGHSTAVTDISLFDQKIRKALADILYSVDSDKLPALPGQTRELKALLVRQSYAFDDRNPLKSKTREIDRQIREISQSISASTALMADRPGLFSSATDGLEEVWTPSRLQNITVSDWLELSEHKASQPDDQAVRLVRGWNWHYVFSLPEEQAQLLKSPVQLRFQDGTEMMFDIEHISQADGGVRVVVLKSDEFLGQYLSERRIGAEIILSTYVGVRIPQNGLRIDQEGQRYVFCVILGSVVRKNVEIISDLEQDNYYLAKHNPGDKNSIMPTDEIITAGKDLYDGKIANK